MKLFQLLLLACLLSCSTQRCPDFIETAIKDSSVNSPITIKKMSCDEYLSISNNQKAEELYNQMDFVATLEAPNLPVGSSFNFYQARLDRSYIDAGEIIINENHEVALKDSCQSIIIHMNNFMPGEPCFYILTSEDGLTHSLKHFPLPLIAEWNDQAKIEMNMILRSAEVFTILGTNFRPGECVKFISRNCGEVITDTLKATDEGKFALMLNADTGQKGVTAEVEFIRENPRSKKTLKYIHGIK